jgi:hypothetical protein
VVRKTLFEACDYLFEPMDEPPYYATCYSTLMNSKNLEVVIRNDTQNPVKIQKNAPLGHMTPLGAQGVFHLDPAHHDLAALPNLERLTGTETPLPNGATIYGSPATRNKLAEVVMTNPDLWTDRGLTCRIPEEFEMPTHLKPGWEDVNLPSKIYPLTNTSASSRNKGRWNWR